MGVRVDELLRSSMAPSTQRLLMLTNVLGDDRRDSFDIYLPVWLAQRNKAIFGPLLGMGLAVAILARIRSP